jgi:predicted transcriptional regulator
LIATVHGALAGIERGGMPSRKKVVPTVPMKRLVQPDAIACLDCG